ncbi:xanthine dehydrogenase subunit XdhB [Synergistes jonesii]|uniref:xanthine dehydrogenase subunit XdhB n=1 Tax=Synergistes jonesii TaxID=2754 RepID=UPI00248E9F04|nr:xanthine dehydrogenase subunit XdhB [Synergistes jonesii]
MLDIASNYIVHNVDEVLELLERCKDTRVIAGGTDLLIKIRNGRLPSAQLISINAVEELKGISLRTDGSLRIGPLVTFRELESNHIIASCVPILACAAGCVGGPQIRAIGTIGGNICNGATSADTAPSLFALNACLLMRRLSGKETMAIEDFYLGPGKVKLSHGTLLTDIIIRREDYEGYRGYYVKYAMRRAMDIATLGCAVQLRVCGGRIVDIRIAFGVAAPVPLRLKQTEAELLGMIPEEALIRGPALVRAEIRPRGSWRASQDFRLHIAGEIFSLAFDEALKRVKQDALYS